MEPASLERFARHRAAVSARLAASGIQRPGPGSVTWKVNREIVVVAGWGRAILLQFAHPLIAAGVHDHSGFRGSFGSSIGRLTSTIRAMLALTFGDDDTAIGAAAGINCIHDRVSGEIERPAASFEAGRRYSAHDPELLRWVHATLLDSVPLIYQLLIGPLSADERDRYCAEGAVMEPLLDIPAGVLPRDAAQLSRSIDEIVVGGRLGVTDTSRALARAVLVPRGAGVLSPAFRILRLITVGTLPPAIREAYGFEWAGREQRAFRRWTAAIRAGLRMTPSLARQWPQARRGSVSGGKRWR